MNKFITIRFVFATILINARLCPVLVQHKSKLRLKFKIKIY